MQQNAYKYLGVTMFSNLGNWSVGHLLKKKIGFTDKYPIVAIGQIIKRVEKESNAKKIEDEKLYTQVTLKTKGGGAVPRGKKFGKEIGTKNQFVVSEGQFIMSKIDARNGAFGIISKELDGAVVTADFPVFDVDASKVLPEYLERIASTEKFAEFAQSCSRGTTNRQRIDVELFLAQEIPLPSLTEQKLIVKAYYDKIQRAEELEKEASKKEKAIDDYILNELGLKQSVFNSRINCVCESLNIYNVNEPQKQNYNYLHFINFKNIERWDCYNNRSEFESSRYLNLTLSQVVKSRPQYGASFSSKKFDNEVRYIRITDINDDGTLNKEKVSADGFSERYILKENDFLIARSGNTVGKSFLYKEKFGKSIYAGYLIKFELDTKKIIPEYLLYYTKCSAYKKWIDENMRVSAQPNINSQQYLESPIIVPPIDFQTYLVSIINRQRDCIKNLKIKAEQLRQNARKAFEKEIFKPL